MSDQMALMYYDDKKEKHQSHEVRGQLNDFGADGEAMVEITGYGDSYEAAMKNFADVTEDMIQKLQRAASTAREKQQGTLHDGQSRQSA